MGFRFRRSIRIAPGVRLNLSKSGVSTSIGGRGATINIGPKGTRHTVGLPGTGLSYSTLAPPGQPGGATPPGGDAPSRNGGGCGVAVLLIAAILIIAKCSGSTSTDASPAPAESASSAYAEPTGAALRFADGDAVTINSAALRTRSEPSATGSVTGSFRKGETATIVRRSGEWLQVAQGAALVWIAANHVHAARPKPQGLLSDGTHPTRARGRHHSTTSRSYFNDDACPCSGSHVCIGPRGGRYCITRGGNKRYGV